MATAILDLVFVHTTTYCNSTCAHTWGMLLVVHTVASTQLVVRRASVLLGQLVAAPFLSGRIAAVAVHLQGPPIVCVGWQ